MRDIEPLSPLVDLRRPGVADLLARQQEEYDEYLVGRTANETPNYLVRLRAAQHAARNAISSRSNDLGPQYSYWSRIGLAGMSGVPIMALLRDNSHLERVQAAAVGATVLLPPKASAADYAAALAAVIQPATCSPASASAIPQDIEAARLQFGTIFDTARRGEIVRKSSIDEATESVMAAISARGIRQWLEVVWTYHNATYQHCLLVTGLAAEFAAILRFTMNDQKRIIGAALLHDLGKAKIPLAILNKPGSLTNKEVEIMRDHARIGYELLSRQGDFEQEQLEVILKHHELLDGSGYPDGLAGSQINDLVRLVTISDIYAALIERRSYKENIHPAEAFKTLQNMEGKLEGALVRAFGKVAERAATAGIRPLS